MELKISKEEIQKRTLLIGTPAYGGMVTAPFHISCVDIAVRLMQMGVKSEHCFIENESLITRARNNIVQMFYRSDEFSRLLFIDADIKFVADDVISLLILCDEENPIVCGNYPKKSINWEIVKSAVISGVPTHELSDYADSPVLNLKVPESGEMSVNISQPIEVLDTGTGFMMLHRSAIEKMIEAYPETNYTPDYSLGNEKFDKFREQGVHALFETMIVDDETSQAAKDSGRKRYLSEDYAFCHLWRKLGGKIWVCPWINLTHHGSYHYKGNLEKVFKLRHEQNLLASGELPTNVNYDGEVIRPTLNPGGIPTISPPQKGTE